MKTLIVTFFSKSCYLVSNVSPIDFALSCFPCSNLFYIKMCLPFSFFAYKLFNNIHKNEQHTVSHKLKLNHSIIIFNTCSYMNFLKNK